MGNRYNPWPTPFLVPQSLAGLVFGMYHSPFFLSSNLSNDVSPFPFLSFSFRSYRLPIWSVYHLSLVNSTKNGRISYQGVTKLLMLCSQTELTHLFSMKTGKITKYMKQGVVNSRTRNCLYKQSKSKRRGNRC